MHKIEMMQHAMKNPEKADSFLKSGININGDMSAIMTKL